MPRAGADIRGKRGGSRLRLLASAAACLALLGSLALLQAGGAAAQAGGAKDCTQGRQPPCVMMIQIDGLEAADVTPQNTPVLWGLAHPSGDGNSDGTPEVPPTPLGEGRNGWIWQAPRASMTAGIAANAASFLIGGYSEQTGITADESFFDSSDHVRLGGPDDPANVDPGTEMREIEPGDLLPPTDKASSPTILSLVKNDLGAKTAAFIGDPNLGKMVIGDLGDTEEVDLGWYPSPQGAGAPSPQNPALCDIPRDPQAAPGGTEGQNKACAASDAQTLAQAFQMLNGDPGVLLTYIELAELGRMKRASTQVDAPGGMTSALQDMDSALGVFLQAYANNTTTQAAWGNTIVMISGTSGYEQTLPDKRVPDPDDDPDQVGEEDEGQDLAHDVSGFQSTAPTPGAGDVRFELVPQGSFATVYATSSPGSGETPAAPSAAHRAAVEQLRARILSVNEEHPDCEPETPGGPPCVAEVLYTRPELAPAGSEALTVDGAHPDWHYDPLSIPNGEPRTPFPNGRGGDLVVVMNPGWGAGKAVPTQDDLTSGEPTTNLLTNPYPASTGGPRNRAVAAIINGFQGADGVRSLADTESRGEPDYDRYPVATQGEVGIPQGTEDDPECVETGSPPPDTDADLDTANATPEDDANEAGHECQAEVLDFAPTVAALLQVSMPADQICGRLLNEAFAEPLTPEVDTEAAPVANFDSGPVTAPEGQTYPQSDKNVTFEFSASEDIRTVIDCGEETPLQTTFECRLDSTSEEAYQPCTSPSQIGPLVKGIHEYCVRAVSGDIKTEPECAKFEVIEFFDFEGLIRDLRAKVTDRSGNTFARAPKKRVLNRIQISGDYGRPLSAVTLTLYKQTTGKKLCGSPVFRPKEAVAAKSSRKAAAASVGASKAAGCPLTGLARFKPFKIDRGHVDLRLRIPPDYKPTHVGVTVQEVLLKPVTPAQQTACSKSQSLLCLYQPAGVAEGGIVKIVNANKLHAVKGKKKKKRK